MNSLKPKFCLSRRIEEYYFEESADDSYGDDYLSICKLFHQRALNKSRKQEINDRVQSVFNEQAYLNYTSFGESLYETSNSVSNQASKSSLSSLSTLGSIPKLNSSSFNRKKYDLVHNQINYFKPTELHKQRQSDVLPLDRYEQILENSPFESPLESYEKAKRRATVLPGFKTQFNNQSTQTSYNNNSREISENDEDLSIFRQSAKDLTPKITNHSIDRSTSRCVPEAGSSKSFNKSSIISSNRSNLSKGILKDLSSKSVNKSSKTQSKNSVLINQSAKKSFANSIAKKSINGSNGSIQDRASKLKDVSNHVRKDQSKKVEETIQKEKRKSKYYDKSDYISFSTAHVYEPSDEEDIIKNRVQTELIESLIESSTFKDLNLESLISKKSMTPSNLIQGKTKNYSGSFTDPISKSSISKSVNKSKPASSSLSDKIDRSTSKSTKNVSKQQSRKTSESTLKRNIAEKSVQQVEEDQLDVSLILNSTCSQESNNEKTKSANKLEDNLELDLSVIGFDNSMQSDIEVVFEEDEEENTPLDDQLLIEEIEVYRKSTSDHPILPELSIERRSINETLSQPESIKKSLNENPIEESNKALAAKSRIDKSENQPKEPENNEQDLSIEFNSDSEKSPIKTLKTSTVQQHSNNLKLTPKSILKKNSSHASKRIWDASDFSFVDLTLGSSLTKSSSANRKSNSVRFSDKVSEKFTSHLSFKRDDKITSQNLKSLDQSIDRSISESISKRIEEAIVASKSERSENEKENEVIQSLPDLDESYNVSLNDKSAENSSRNDSKKSTRNESKDLEESDEESLNVTIDELSESLIDIEEDENDEKIEEQNYDHTPTNVTNKHQSTFTVKSLKKPVRKTNFINFKQIKKQLPKYYETFVDKTPTIIYPNHDDNETADPVRRSSRIRVRPLDFWRNQNPKYKLDKETQCLTIDGIQKGFGVDNPFKRKRFNLNRPKRCNKKKSKKRIHHSDDEQENEIVIKKVRYTPNDEISIHQELNKSAIELSEKIKSEATEFCSHNALKWSESKQSKGVFIAFMNRNKDKEGKTTATGFMKLKSSLKKPPQKTGNYITNYVVMFGAACVKINDNQGDKLENKPAVILKSMDGFTVEANTLFSIDNLRTDELLLYFHLTKL